MQSDVLVVVPTYNEAENIELIARGIALHGRSTMQAQVLWPAEGEPHETIAKGAHIEDVRDFRNVSADSLTPGWYDRTWDLGGIETLWVIISPKTCLILRRPWRRCSSVRSSRRNACP